MIVSSLVAALALSTSAQAASPGKAAICHWSEGTASVISVSVNAVAQHMAQHGDSLASTYYADVDGDGFGDAGGATDPCPNAGFVADATDCDDGDAAVNPAAAEVAYDGVDNDCSSTTLDDDLDQDGYLLADDCNDGDSAINPGADEVCGNETDDNCDGSNDEGCASDCPCFTAADIDAAYADYLEFEFAQSYDYQYSYSQCYEVDYSYQDYYGYDYDYTYVYFDHYGYSYDPYAYEEDWSGFYGLSQTSDYYGYNYTVCYAYDNSYAYDGYNYVYDNQYTYLYVTEEEAEGCEQVVRDWAADNGMECPLYSY